MHPGRARRAGVPHGGRAQALRAPQCLAPRPLDCTHDTLGLCSARPAVLERLNPSGALQWPFLIPFLCQVLVGTMVLSLPAEAAVCNIWLQLASCSTLTTHEACHDAKRSVLSGSGLPPSSLAGTMACACAPLKNLYRPGCAPWLCVCQAHLCGGPSASGVRPIQIATCCMIQAETSFQSCMIASLSCSWLHATRHSQHHKDCCCVLLLYHKECVCCCVYNNGCSTDQRPHEILWQVELDVRLPSGFRQGLTALGSVGTHICMCLDG